MKEYFEAAIEALEDTLSEMDYLDERYTAKGWGKYDEKNNSILIQEAIDILKQYKKGD